MEKTSVMAKILKFIVGSTQDRNPVIARTVERASVRPFWPIREAAVRTVAFITHHSGGRL